MLSLVILQMEQKVFDFQYNTAALFCYSSRVNAVRHTMFVLVFCKKHVFYSYQLIGLEMCSNGFLNGRLFNVQTTR